MGAAFQAGCFKLCPSEVSRENEISEKPVEQYPDSPYGEDSRALQFQHPDSPIKLVGDYYVDMTDDGQLGEGTYCICYRARLKGQADVNKYNVAVKFYRIEVEHMAVEQFERQVEVLKEFQGPLKKPKDKKLWHADLERDGGELFVKLLAHAAPRESPMYVATEMGQYTLRDYILFLKEGKRRLGQESLWSISKAVFSAVAAMHAKGLVHLDIKPENMMVFGGRLKLIDIDSCLTANNDVDPQKDMLTLTPVYCPPEMAQLLVDAWKKGKNKTMKILPTLDVWSVGLMLCEMVTFEVLLHKTFRKIFEEVGDPQEAGTEFLKQLAQMKVELPKDVETHADFRKMLKDKLLVKKASYRKQLAELLSHASVAGAADMQWEEISMVDVKTRRDVEIARGGNTPSFKLLNDYAKARAQSSQRNWAAVTPLAPPDDD